MLMAMLSVAVVLAAIRHYIHAPAMRLATLPLPFIFSAAREPILAEAVLAVPADDGHPPPLFPLLLLLRCAPPCRVIKLRCRERFISRLDDR
jgi:hypothetical protein